MASVPEILSERPTECASGAALCGTVYGLLTQLGVGPEIAAPIALLVAVVPILVSDAVDLYRAMRRPLRICGVVSNSGPNQEPLACGYAAGHLEQGIPHSWSTLPTFTQASRGSTETPTDAFGAPDLG